MRCAQPGLVRAPKPSYAYKTWRLEDCVDVDDGDADEAKHDAACPPRWDDRLVHRPGDATSRHRLKTVRDLSSCKVAYSHPAWPLMSEVEGPSRRESGYQPPAGGEADVIMASVDIMAKYDQFLEERGERKPQREHYWPTANRHDDTGSTQRWRPSRHPKQLPVTQRYQNEIQRHRK